MDSDYKWVLKNEEKLQKEDKLNLEYVAFTRAKNSLIILKRKDKKFFETSLDVEKSNIEYPRIFLIKIILCFLEIVSYWK